MKRSDGFSLRMPLVLRRTLLSTQCSYDVYLTRLRLFSQSNEQLLASMYVSSLMLTRRGKVESDRADESVS